VTKISARWLAAAVLFAWTLLPAIACAADFRQMSEPEMACCKKMAGKCDMGTGQHSCCDQTAHSQGPTRAIQTQVFQLERSLHSAVIVEPVTPQVVSESFCIVVSNGGSPPESPPGSITILRI
jgi:hypothetical protein